MNTQHRDILTAIGRKEPITTSGVAEYLMDHFGYGGGMEFDTFRDQVSKTIGYLKSKGELVGYDAPQDKGKPLRYWSLANPQSDCQSAEMASDVAKVEAVTEKSSATVQESLTVADAKLIETLDSLDTVREIEERQAVAESVETFADKAPPPKPATMPVSIALAEFCSYSWKEGTTLAEVFMTGIAFAEEYHKIGPNENGDYL